MGGPLTKDEYEFLALRERDDAIKARAERDRYRAALDGIGGSEPFSDEGDDQHRDRLQAWARDVLRGEE